MKTFSRRLEDAFRLLLEKTSWSRPIYSPYTYVFRRRLQDVFKVSWSRPIYSSWSYVFKTSSRRLEDVLPRALQDVFKMFWRDFRTFSRGIITLIVLVNTISRRLWDVFKTFLRRTAKTVIYVQEDLTRLHFWENYGQCTKFARAIKVSL